jgi:hypothetical protein
LVVIGETTTREMMDGQGFNLVVAANCTAQLNECISTVDSRRSTNGSLRAEGDDVLTKLQIVQSP